MSTDFSIRPVGSPAPSPIVPPFSPAANNAVSTELPASQTVTAADAGTSVRNDPIDINDVVSRQAYFDRDAHAMVYQVVDDKTDQVVTQYPDEAVLRRRAYFQALDQSRSARPRVIPTDRLA